MRTIILLAVIVTLAACSPSTSGSRYLNRDGNAASWGEGKREINTSLADVITKDDL